MKKYIRVAAVLMCAISYVYAFDFKKNSDIRVSAGSSVDDRGLYHLDQNLVLEGDVQGKGFLVTKSNITLDCAGATVDGLGSVPAGVLIDSRGETVSDITIKNCHFKNFKYSGIRVGWSIFDHLKPAYHAGSLYEKHPKNIVISNVSIVNSGSIGIYVDDYVDGVVIDHAMVSGSGDVGLYLEHGSKNNIVQYSIFKDNGKKARREAIAIDGSYHNKIYKNTFQKNGQGAIFLYKNCQEKFSSGRSALRLFGANDNLIDQNDFFSEDVGVWIASRQSKNLSKFDCGISSIYKNIFYLDFSDYNQVLNNNFCNVEHGIVVEGNYNILANNYFNGFFKNSVLEPVTAKKRFTGVAPVGNIYGVAFESTIQPCKTLHRNNKGVQ